MSVTWTYMWQSLNDQRPDWIKFLTSFTGHHTFVQRRDLAFPFRVRVRNVDEIPKHLLEIGLRKHTDCYISVYEFEYVKEDGTPDYSSAIIDRVFIDIDSLLQEDDYNDDKLLRGIPKILDMNRTLPCRLYFSGKKGFHCYIDLKEIIEKQQLTNIQKLFYNRFRIDVEPSIIGDIARVARIPHTVHPKSELFCMPINANWSLKNIMNRAAMSSPPEYVFKRYITYDEAMNKLRETS